MALLFFWKLWLSPNYLSKDVDNDYIAEVSTVGNTLRNEDIARLIVKGRSEIRLETIVSILGERDAVVRDTLLNGSSVQDGNFHMSPRVTGLWTGSVPVYDPREHKITVESTATLEMRKALEDVGVEILGKKAGGGAVIGLVTDLLSGKTDGSITVNGDIAIRGEKIKVAPADEEGLGVFFVAADGTEIPLEYPASENSPKKIICRVPTSLTPGGVYTLKIVTRYSNSSQCLKQPRTIEYELPLTVEVNAAKS
jgi:hypothetical protein